MLENPPYVNRLIVVVIIVFFGFLIYLSDYAQWAIRLSMATLFCSIIYVRDSTSNDRWIAIAIIAIGTLLSLIWQP